MLGALLDLIYPKRCIFCKEINDYFADIEVCEPCNLKLPYKIGKEGAMIKSGDGNAYDELICIFDYVNPVKKAIADYKYNGKKRYAGTFAKIIQNSTKSTTNFEKFDIIMSVPIHKNRMKERGYNQSYLITERLSNEYKLQEGSHFLTRIVDTMVQSKLKKSDRIINMKKVFELDKTVDLKDMSILVFDDILTTGATLNSCCGELKSAGAGKITAMVIASGS